MDGKEGTPAGFPDRPALVQGSETVLLVEDEAPRLRLTRRFLEAMGDTVLTANILEMRCNWPGGTRAKAICF